MTSRLDQILQAIAKGDMTLDAACRAIAAAARENPSGTRLWPMLIETRVAQNQLAPAAGRALADALQDFEPEKTMWIAPAEDNSRVSRGDVLATPTSASKIRPQPAIETAEQLRAFLWDGASVASKSSAQDAIALDNVPTLAPPPNPRADAPPSLPPLELGMVLKNRFRLESRLGFSGIGQIFNAVDLQTEREGRADPRVTLKVVAVDLRREPQALMAMKIAVAKIKFLDHPNIVKTFGVESDNERLFVTMEPLFGRWLGERIRAVRNVGVAQDIAWPVIEGIANGLAYAHAQDIVHSDLSPYAVFLTEDGTPKIMGFGLVHALPTSNEAMDLVDTMTLRAYTEAYTANPWATHAIPHPADDLYPLGVIAYELLTGNHPFERCSLATARRRNLEFAPIPGLKRRAAKLLERCLSFERKERPHDAGKFLARLHGHAWRRFILGDGSA